MVVVDEGKKGKKRKFRKRRKIKPKPTTVYIIECPYCGYMWRSFAIRPLYRCPECWAYLVCDEWEDVEDEGLS